MNQGFPSGSGSDHLSFASQSRSNPRGSISSRDDHAERKYQYPKVVSGNGSSNILNLNQRDDEDQDDGEISFVLERNVAASPYGGKVGMFTLALIMCICCCSTFFTNHSTSILIGNQASDGQP